MSIITTEHEQQRFEHLVLGRPRPKPGIGRKPSGMSKQEWRAQKVEIRTREQTLLPGIEERVQMQELYGHKQGTPETRAHHAAKHGRSGAIARLYASGTIDADQLAAADKIHATFRAVTADAPIRTASLEARTGGGGASNADLPMLTAVDGQWALDWWLRSLKGSPTALLDVIVHDVGLTIVADRYALSMPRARRMLTEALSLWWARFGRGDVTSS